MIGMEFNVGVAFVLVYVALLLAALGIGRGYIAWVRRSRRIDATRRAQERREDEQRWAESTARGNGYVTNHGRLLDDERAA